MKHYGIDRFEGNIAVLVDVEGCAINVNREDLPFEVKEGQIVRYDGENYYIDSVETEKKREESKALIDELFQ